MSTPTASSGRLTPAGTELEEATEVEMVVAMAEVAMVEVAMAEETAEAVMVEAVWEEGMAAEATVAAAKAEATAVAATAVEVQVVVKVVVTVEEAMGVATAECQRPRQHSNARQASHTPRGSRRYDRYSPAPPRAAHQDVHDRIPPKSTPAGRRDHSQ